MNNVILKYPGSKWRLADWIISNFPQHKVYVEPFFGSGAVYFSKKPSHIETINDLNNEVYNFFKVLREQPEELATLINLTPHCREEYYNSYNQDEKITNLEKARRFAVKCWQSFGASQHKNNGFRTGIAPTAPQVAKIWNKLPLELIKVAKRLKNAQIENRSALEIIEKYNSSETLIYLDPPYMHETRKFTKHYEHEMSNLEHEKLLQLIKNSKSKIILSGYDNDLYNKTLKNWKKIKKQTICENSTQRVEVLWMNFESNPIFELLDRNKIK